MSILISDLPRVQIAALRQKAGRLGLSPEHYLKRLIADDLELDAVAARTPFEELAKPFRAALKDLSETELNRLARRRNRKKL